MTFIQNIMVPWKTMPKYGKIIEPANANVRDHERRTARALASTGHDVEFIVKSERDFTSSADISFVGEIWEAKSPLSQKPSQWEKNLKVASGQSQNIIFDSQRVKGVPDEKIIQFLKDRADRQRVIKKLIFIDRKRKVIDIKS